MQTVWKFPLSTDSATTVPMPKGAEILTLQMQGGSPCIWAKVDPNAEIERRAFRIFGTGHGLPPMKLDYVGTFQVNDGGSPLVFHVFETTT